MPGLEGSDGAKHRLGLRTPRVVSSTLDRVDWNAELVRGDLGTAVQQLKQKSGKGLVVAGVKLPLALAELADLDKTILEALVANSVTGSDASAWHKQGA